MCSATNTRPLQHALRGSLFAGGKHRLVFAAGEYLTQFGAHSRFHETRRLWSCRAWKTLLVFAADMQRLAIQAADWRQIGIEIVEVTAPAGAYLTDQFQGASRRRASVDAGSVTTSSS
jgi:hypothetical protein